MTDYAAELQDKSRKGVEFDTFEMNAVLMKELQRLHNYCDYNCKTFPHKTAENYAYWDIQDKISDIIANYNPQ